MDKFTPTMDFRWIVRDIRKGKTNAGTVGVPAGGPKMYVLQQKFIDTYIGHTFEWRDVPLMEIENEEPINE